MIMKLCGLNLDVVKPVMLLFCGLSVIGCDSNLDSDSLTNEKPNQFSDNSLTFDGESLTVTVNSLADILVAASKSVLENLNAQVAISGVPEALSGCLSTSDFPVTEYFCGSEGEGVRLSEFGYPLHEFRFAESDGCTAELLNSQGAASCVLEVAEAELEQDWYVRYRTISNSDGRGVTSVQVSKGFFPSINDPSFATDICIVTLLGEEVVSYNDVLFCDSVLRDVAELAGARL